MPIAKSSTQLKIYVAELINKLMKKFPKRVYYLKKLTEGNLSTKNSPKHFVIKEKGKFFTWYKALEGFSTKNSGKISIWEKDEEARKTITSIINEENKKSTIKFEIEFR